MNYHEVNNKEKALPTVTASEIKMEPDVEAARTLLERAGATDLLEVLGL